MKKSSIIAVGIIYLVSIIIVGFLGVRLKVYDPTIYVEKIVWDYSEFENNNNYKIEIPTEEEKRQGVDYDAKLRYSQFGKIQNLVINIKCHVEPLNATTPKLEYYLNTNDNSKVKLEELEDNTANIIFNGKTSVYLNIKSTDGKDIKYTILFQTMYR